MARQSDKLNSYTGYFGTYKGIVTRPYTDDPLGLGRLQVWIPFYHGGSNYDNNKVGHGNDPGEYPWAQVSSIRFGAGSTNTGGGFDFWGSLLGLFGGAAAGASSSTTGYNGGSTYAQEIKLADIVYPNVNDPVWLQFENGDIRYPIYVGSLVNGNETISGSPAIDIAKATKDMIVTNGANSDYNYINWKDETGKDGIGVGMLQWHNSKAKELITEIKNIDSDGFNVICRENKCTDFNTLLGNKLRWNPAKFDKGSDQGKTIQALLDTNNSRTAQENIIAKDVQRHISIIKSKGYVDVGAIMICADYYNENNSMPNIKVNPASVTTQEFLNTLLNISNLQRWKNDYDYIMSLVSQGLLTMGNNGLLTIPLLPGENNQEMFIFPVPDCSTISRNFSRGTGGINSIDISEGPNTYGLDVVASHDGTAKFGYDPNKGNYVEVEYHAPTVTSSAVANIALQEWNNGNNPYYQPRNGKTKYSSSGAWCAFFATWCCVQAGVMSSQIGYVPSVEDHFRSKGMFGTHPDYKPVIGDLLTMRHSGGNHIGVVVAVNGDIIDVCDGNSRDGAPKSENKSRIARTQFSWSENRSTGSGYYKTVGYCKTGNAASSGAASQYNSVITEYYHLNTKIADSGTKEVKAGDKIGTVGSTGKCSGPLLEFAMKTNGSYIDPMSKMSTPALAQPSGQKGNLVGNYKITMYYPDGSSMEGTWEDMRGNKLNAASLDTVALPHNLLKAYGGPFGYGDKIIIEGISNLISGKNTDVCIVRDTGSILERRHAIDFLATSAAQMNSWHNPNLNVYYCK